MLNEPGDGVGIDRNDRLSSGKLPRSNKGAVIEVVSLVIEEPPSLRTEPAPSKTGDLAKMREDPLLPSFFCISRGSSWVEAVWGYTALQRVTISAGQRTKNGCTSGVSGGEVTVLVETRTGGVLMGRGHRNLSKRFSICVLITGSTGVVVFLEK
jgi:hypothetical protein